MFGQPHPIVRLVRAKIRPLVLVHAGRPVQEQSIDPHPREAAQRRQAGLADLLPGGEAGRGQVTLTERGSRSCGDTSTRPARDRRETWRLAVGLETPSLPVSAVSERAPSSSSSMRTG